MKTATLFPDAVITADLLPHLRLEGRYELVDGRIEPLSPNNVDHGEAMARIAGLLIQRMVPGFHVLCGDPGITLGPKTVRAPDILAISSARRPQVDGAYLTVPPELAVEILSPSNTTEDIDAKVAAYLAFGVDDVWIVDIDASTLTRYQRPLRPPQVFSQRGTSLALPNGANVFLYEIFGA